MLVRLGIGAVEYGFLFAQAVRMIRPRILLVNPPIYDFAAYDFWLRPYGVLSVAGQLRGQADFGCLTTSTGRALCLPRRTGRNRTAGAGAGSDRSVSANPPVSKRFPDTFSDSEFRVIVSGSS